MASTKIQTTAIWAPPSSVTQYDTQGFVNSEAIVVRPCVFVGSRGVSKSGSTLWIMFFDAAAVPSNGTVPIMAPIQVAANTSFSLPIMDGGQTIVGLQFSTGLVWAASTTSASLTADTTNSIWLSARYY